MSGTPGARRRLTRWALIGAAAAGFAWMPPADASAAARCGNVAFEPNSDFGAFDIRVSGVGCKTGRAVARASRRKDVVHGPFVYRSHGFSCRGRRTNDALPSVRWRCTKGRARVTFSRS